MKIKALWQNFMSAFPATTFKRGINNKNIPGNEFPNELREIYLLSNGQDEKSIGVFQAKSGYSKFSRPRLLSIEQIHVLWIELKENKELDIFEPWFIPFATDNLKNPDDVFCFDTHTGKILLLWVLAADPFNPPDWQYYQFEVADTLEQFIIDQSELAGVKIITPTIAPEQKLQVKAGLKTTKPVLFNGGVLLYYLETENCKSTIQAYFNNENVLVIDGYDIGKFVETYFGDSDYEYKMTIPSKQITELNKLLNIPLNSKQELLLELAKQYNTGTCFSEIKEFLDNNHIKYDYFSWT